MEMFSYVKRGYNPEEVNAYINTLEQVIKSYKDKDNAIKNAIISAQVAADNIIKNAQAQAGEYKTILRKQLQTVRQSIEKQRAEVSLFQDTYNVMLRKYLKNIESGDFDGLEQQLTNLQNSIDGLDKDVVFETAAEAPEAAAEEPTGDKVFGENTEMDENP